jgi:hypothetical protein
LANGSGTVDHRALVPILEGLDAAGVETLSDNIGQLESYRNSLQSVDPDTLDPPEALAYWMNLYNAGALWTVGGAFNKNVSSVLRIPGAFSRPWANVQGVQLSLDDIEHGKIRRFRDPRIHGALVCGSASCPTLRAEPYTGSRLDDQLDDQLRFFIANGGGILSESENRLRLSSVFRWFGRDFTHPHTMPNIAPAPIDRLRDTLAVWAQPGDAEIIWANSPDVEFMPYDWGLGCSVA